MVKYKEEIKEDLKRGVFFLKKTNKKRFIIGLSVAWISIILSIICFFVLPDRVTVNISFKNEASYMDKNIAVAFPLVLSIITTQIYIRYYSIFGKKSESELKSELKSEESKDAFQEDSRNNSQNISQNNLQDGIKYLAFSVVGILLTLWILFKNL